MCMMSAPSRAPAPPPIPAPPPVPTKQDPNVQQNIARDRRMSALAQGRQSTILTGGMGLTTPATYGARKSALGA